VVVDWWVWEHHREADWREERRKRAWALKQNGWPPRWGCFPSGWSGRTPPARRAGCFLDPNCTGLLVAMWAGMLALVGKVMEDAGQHADDSGDADDEDRRDALWGVSAQASRRCVVTTTWATSTWSWLPTHGHPRPPANDHTLAGRRCSAMLHNLC
jgi:hypothetical protein